MVMALFSAIRSGLSDEEKKRLAQLQSTPTAQPSAQLTKPPKPGLIEKAATGIKNFFAPSPNGVRVRDIVRELPGAAVQVADKVADFTVRPIVTRPAAQVPLSISDHLDLKENRDKGKEINTIPVKGIVPRVLFGKDDLKSYQQQTRDITNFTKNLGVPEQYAVPTGIMLGTINAGLDLPGGSVLKEPAKEVVEKGAKKFAVKSVDELAPFLKEILPTVKGDLDNALKTISQRVEIPKAIINKLKSGKVVEGEGFVFQALKDKFVANFDDTLQALPLPELKQVVKSTKKAAKETVDFVEDITGRAKFSGLKDKAKDVLEEVANDPAFKKLVERTKGAPVTEAEVRQAATNLQDTLGKAVSRKSTVEEIGKATNSFDKADQLMNADGAVDEIAKYLNEGLSFLTDAARKLQSGKNISSPDSIVGDPLIKEIYQRTGNITGKVIEAYKKIDRNNPQQVRDFYYTYAKPTLSSIVDEYRYINMLSSPKTHLRNINANLIDSIITEPGTKLMRGFVDRVKSVITRQPRQHFSREALEYYKGFFNAGSEAVNNVKAVMQGNRFIGNPDLQALPIGKYAQPTLEEAFKGIKLPGAKTASNITARGLEIGTNVNKALEAMDVFFTTLIKRGEEASQVYRQSRGVELTEDFIKTEADRVAQEVALRTALDPSNKTKQGIIATGIDQVASFIGQARKSQHKAISATANVTFPFLRTTANYLTRLIEYTPGLGAINAIGRANVDELIARQAFGSTVLAGTLFYAFRSGAEDNMTWDAPAGETEKNLFYDSGRIPYAIKIGNDWYGYQQLGMLGAPFALTAALKNELDQGKDLSENQLQSVAKAYASMLGFFGDMSFARGFGNLADAFKGNKYAINKALNEPIRQAIPLAGFQGWAKSMIDTAYRQNLAKDPYSPAGVVLTALAPTLKNLPFFSTLYEPYRDSLGNVSRIDKPLFNATSPISVTSNNQLFDFAYQFDRIERQATKLQRDFKDGKINAGGLERGVNNLLDNIVNFAGGDPTQIQDFNVPSEIEKGFRVPQEEDTPIKLTPEQEKELINQIPQIKKELLANLSKGVSSIASTPARGVSLSAKTKVSAPNLSKSKARGIALKASTPTKTKGVSLRPAYISSASDLAESLPDLPRFG